MLIWLFSEKFWLALKAAGTLFLRQEEGTYEIRKYKAARYATLTSEGKPFDQSTGECMKKMLLYVGGNNDKGESEIGRSLYVTP